MKTLIFLLITLQALSPTLSAPLKDSDVDADGVHNHEDPAREGKWTFNYKPGYINVHSATGDNFSIGHDADIKIEETIAEETTAEETTPELSDCKYRYREVQSDCICRSILKPDGEGVKCSTNEVCTNNAGCYKACEPGKITSYKCYCKELKTGSLSLIPCPQGNRCVSDGHCHYDYEVSGVSTRPITASFGSILWTNKPHRITTMPGELVNSILFQPEDLVAEATIQLSSPKVATVFLALHESQHGGLTDLLPQQDWTLKEEGSWVVTYLDYDRPDQLKIWYKQIEENGSISFTTNEDGAKFVIFFSTDCEDPSLWKDKTEPRAFVNCLCKSGNNDPRARHCKTGQGCKDGSCLDLPPLFVGRK